MWVGGIPSVEVLARRNVAELVQQLLGGCICPAMPVMLSASKTMRRTWMARFSWWTLDSPACKGHCKAAAAATVGRARLSQYLKGCTAAAVGVHVTCVRRPSVAGLVRHSMRQGKRCAAGYWALPFSPACESSSSWAQPAAHYLLKSVELGPGCCRWRMLPGAAWAVVGAPVPGYRAPGQSRGCTGGSDNHLSHLTHSVVVGSAVDTTSVQVTQCPACAQQCSALAAATAVRLQLCKGAAIPVWLQFAEAALADEWVIAGDRVALQRRVLRLGKAPRRWKRPAWGPAVSREPLEVSMALLCPSCASH